MNARASALVAALRALLATLPGASAISLHVSELWTLVVITAESDEAVRALGAMLELGAPAIRTTAEHWWLRAAAERDLGALRVTVLGPRHRNPPPPPDDAARSS
jgi:hypothetical protein